ncbi:serpin B3-like isoform X2 [Daktulosphaira vitifoliae]|uniref:serpin B3-like isoform X2 n=1 Tax=Daktulosphaira vitifoliae TaxID=58002 RepID=UPI0021A9FC43|nr:serpin B3-like isoform X2 [Daktulosphaira vitifoliae]
MAVAMNNIETLRLANHEFSKSLYSSLNTNNENLFYSPLSIHVVLLMAGIGATSKTSDEIFDTIHLPRNKSLIEAYDYLLNDIGRFRNSANLVTGMFVEKTFKIKSSYAEKIKKHLKSTVENLDFNKKPNDQRSYINGWIENKTNGKIKNLFPADSISESTVMVLTSALHFKDLWEKEFYTTKDEPFYSMGQHAVNVKMMYQHSRYYYYHDKHLKFAALDMPYVNFHFKMLILLPDAKDGLSNLENNLSKINFIELYKNMTKHNVDFKFPKFKIEQEIDLKHVLNKLGCSTMFTPSADFSGITDVPIFANKAFHKAFIDVDEKGTEAAAASGIEFLEGSAMPTSLPKAQFHVDHPFIFAILTNENDLLFLGNLKKPSS